jgi:hypothetical protein
LVEGAVIDLPAALASWAPQLAVLPHDVALSLAPWIGRLALAVGPLAATQREHAGEPDGYSGLARRGSYERLVTAEWGIAELFPDEFLRRASAGEHLFLELARREPHGALRSIAIVSAGPAQLGSPRLAQVAALIVLARRAAAAGAGFSWGVLEDREHRLNDGLDEEGIQRLIAARTAVPAESDAFKRWSDAIGREPTHDFWFIGADEDAASAAQAGASRIIVRDLLAPNTRALDVEIDRRGPPTRLRLDLPASDQCVRLFRDPFARGGSPRVVPAKAPALDVRFAPAARKLILRLNDGSFETWPIPSSPRDKVGSPRKWEPPRHHAVVAIGIGRRSVLAATVTRDDPTALELHYSNNHTVRVMLPNRVAAELTERLARREPLPIGSCALLRLREHSRTDLVLDVLGRLLVVPRFSLWPRPGTTLIALSYNGTGSEEGPPALATAFFPTSFVWAERHELGQIHIFEGTASGNQRVAILGAREQAEVQFGFSLPPVPSWGPVAVAWDAEHRRVAAPKLPPTTIKVVVPVVGVCLRDGVPWLLTRPHPYRLAWLAGDRRELLPTAAAPIAAVAVSPSQPEIAWVTEAGEVIVYSMLHNAVLLRRTATGAP